MSPRSDGGWVRCLVIVCCAAAIALAAVLWARPAPAESEPARPTSKWTVHKVSSFWSAGPEVWLIREEVTGRTWLHSTRGGLVEVRP